MNRRSILDDPDFWARGWVCDECCLPLDQYGFNDFSVGDPARLKLYCDLHAEEFRMGDDAAIRSRAMRAAGNERKCIDVASTHSRKRSESRDPSIPL